MVGRVKKNMIFGSCGLVARSAKASAFASLRSSAFGDVLRTAGLPAAFYFLFHERVRLVFFPSPPPSFFSFPFPLVVPFLPLCCPLHGPLLLFHCKSALVFAFTRFHLTCDFRASDFSSKRKARHSTLESELELGFGFAKP
jgi:hypothetical protein